MKIRLKSVPELIKEGYEFGENGDLKATRGGEGIVRTNCLNILGKTFEAEKNGERYCIESERYGMDAEYNIDMTEIAEIIEPEKKLREVSLEEFNTYLDADGGLRIVIKDGFNDRDLSAYERAEQINLIT